MSSTENYMTNEGDSAVLPHEVYEKVLMDEFLRELAGLHEANSTTPTLSGIELEERMREFAQLHEEYAARTKNDTDGKETEFIEELWEKLGGLEEYIARLRIEYEKEFDQAQHVVCGNGTVINTPQPNSFTHPGNTTLN